MNEYLNSRNFPFGSADEERELSRSLDDILREDARDSVFAMLGRYRQILADNHRHGEWEGIFRKLDTLYKCGKYQPLNGPMIGVTMAIRDSDYFRETARLFGRDRSSVANIEWMATSWNATFAGSGLWMGKTFEPVSKETYANVCGTEAAAAFDAQTTRIGRNFFRQPANPDFITGLGLPVLTQLWRLKDRPTTGATAGFEAALLPENIKKEKNIPYIKTGGYFLAQPGASVVPEMNKKKVYQLNYRWPKLEPVYPMTRLIDELVQIADGVYLGQLVMATKHYSIGTLGISLFNEKITQVELGESYQPGRPCGIDRLIQLIGLSSGEIDYGYQNNGFFLMIDPAFAKEAYADNAFSILRPRSGESGYVELGYDRSTAGKVQTSVSVDESNGVSDWTSGWRNNSDIRKKFTTFFLEPSPKESDEDVQGLLRDGESILQMLQRIQGEISAQTSHEDHLRHFEKLNRLFRRGIAPRINGGLFQGVGKGYNVRLDAPETRNWYGQEDPCTGLDYYHGATLNLHFGLSDTISQEINNQFKESPFLPTALIPLLESDSRGPNFVNAFWASIGRFIFPWAGKSFEKIGGRKLSMLLDESDDLEKRYPERVAELRDHLASSPHYDLVKKNREHFWKEQGPFAKYLKSGSWDKGMSESDKAFWQNEANAHWVFGNNLQDSRILDVDEVFRVLDMNYHAPLPSLQKLADSGPSPFVRQGYCFLGVSDRESILPMNNGDKRKKKVFQFHYRYPLIGGPFPIGACLDELVEIAEGLFLGQLIYTTVPFKPFHSSVDTDEYKYQLFGYFLLLDNIWERHRQAIGLDTLCK
jgi:hypothetical protein